MAENTVETEVMPASEHTVESKKADTTRDESRYLTPAVDIYETDEGLTLDADMPGVLRDGLDIRVEDNILTIRGRVGNGSKGTELFKEYELHDYFRQFKLNDQIDQEKIEAHLSNGVLTLKLPKAKAARPRQIEIKTL